MTGIARGSGTSKLDYVPSLGLARSSFKLATTLVVHESVRGNLRHRFESVD